MGRACLLKHSPGNLSVIIRAILKSASAATAINYGRMTTASACLVSINAVMHHGLSLISNHVWLHCVIPVTFIHHGVDVSDCRPLPMTLETHCQTNQYKMIIDNKSIFLQPSINFRENNFNIPSHE